MIKIMLDDAVSEMFDNVSRTAELCDTSGRVLGYFAAVASEPLYREVKCPYTDEELRRFADEPGGRTLAEILADLEKLG